MPDRHHIRELALQALYQYDARGEADVQEIEQSVRDAPNHAAELAQRAIELARGAWASRAQADAMGAELAPDWPTHRQPIVDRNLIRLAYYEIASGLTPPAVAINEAIELAKTFGSERSPAFINGVLDKIAARLNHEGTKPDTKDPARLSRNQDK